MPNYFKASHVWKHQPARKFLGPATRICILCGRIEEWTGKRWKEWIF